MENLLVPENVKGKEVDLYYSLVFDNVEETQQCYNRAVKRLTNPNIWHELSGPLSAHFVLTGEHGDEVTRLAQEHDHIRIDIPAPGNKTGNGHDWVVVEKLVVEDAMTGMRVGASCNPKNKDGNIAHFFEKGATSTFIIRKEDHKVSVSYHGRNEVPNNETDTTVDNIRNTVIANGARIGLSELQWSALIEGLLEAEIGG